MTSCVQEISRVVSAVCYVGWTSHAHTAVDVPLAAVGPGAERFLGSLETREIGQALFDLLGLDAKAGLEHSAKLLSTSAPKQG